MANIPPSWILTREDELRIFNEQIVPAEIEPYAPHHLTVSVPTSDSDPENTTTTCNNNTENQPTAIFIVGQTGAGKTLLAPILYSALSSLSSLSSSPQRRQLQPAHFIADTYKTYHPHYTTCLASPSSTLRQQASTLAGPPARRWLSMACAKSAQLRISALVESACRHAEDFVSLARGFHLAGYRVRVVVMAVPRALSQLGCLARYWRRAPEAGSRGLPVRMTPGGVHDESYAGVVEVAGFVDSDSEDPDEGAAVDGVVLVRRGGLVAYENERVPRGKEGGGKTKKRVWEVDVSGGEGEGEGGGGLVGALERERKRGLLEDERRMAREDMEELRRHGDLATNAQVDEIERLFAGLGADDAGPFPELRPLRAVEFVRKGVP